jgi:hypothetical protein
VVVASNNFSSCNDDLNNNGDNCSIEEIQNVVGFDAIRIRRLGAA